MPGIARRTDAVATDHLCTLNTTCLGASVDTLAGGLGVHRLTDGTTPHTYCTVEGGNCADPEGTDCSPHTPALGTASPNVFVNSLAVGRIGDTYVVDGCGAITGWAVGTPTVFVN